MRTSRLALLVPVLLAAACTDGAREALEPSSGSPESDPMLARGGASGAVYVATNDAAGNAVLVFPRAASGALGAPVAHPTGGLGSGGGLGNQGGLALSHHGRILAVVNAGSDEVTTFRITGGGLDLAGTVGSGGDQPVSVAMHGRLVYVLNDGAAPNVHGFRMQRDGSLLPIPGSARPLSGAAVPDAAQVSFSPDGSRLVVTEKATNLVTTFGVLPDGTLGPSTSQPSAAPTPFGFAFDRRGTLVVSEANGGAAGASFLSSYRADGAGWAAVTAAAPTTQTAACWVVISPNGRFVYTTNTGSASVSGFALAQDGQMALLDGGVSGTTGAGPIDMDMSRNGRYLYTLNAGGNSISAFRVDAQGGLTAVGTTAGLPAGANGLVSD